MATAKELLNIARAELGYKETPAGSNLNKYGKWYGLNGQPWCVIFVMWVFARAGVNLPTRTASCTTLRDAAIAAECWVTGDYRKGDIVIYDWHGNNTPDHCGIVDEVEGATVAAIEGNTAVGNDSNGGAVMRRSRPLNQILGAVRPIYEVEPMDNTPSPAHKEGVDWAVKNGILQGGTDGDLMLSQPVTRQQLCTFLKRLYDLKKGK